MKKSTQRIKNCRIGKSTKVWDFVNLYGCSIGNDCMIGAFVEIQKGVKIGDNVRVQSHAFICEGVTIEDGAFIGHHAVFINDKYPTVQNKNWEAQKTLVKSKAVVGSNATVLGGVIIGENSIVGAGSVVTKNVASNAVVAGNPARIIKHI